MLDVHPPHEAAHSWKDFFIHIATIVVGLLIAVGLEQTVEAVHHHYERDELRHQLLEVLHDDLAVDADDLHQLASFRSFLVEQEAAIIAHRAGKSAPAGPPFNDPRMKTSLALPSIAPYEVATQNGVVSVLPPNEVRLFNRIQIQRDFLANDARLFIVVVNEWSGFAERFTDSPGNPGFGGVIATPALEKLSAAELIEYQTIIARLIKQADVSAARLQYFDVECRSVLNGNRQEDKLFEQLNRINGQQAPPATP